MSRRSSRGLLAAIDDSLMTADPAASIEAAIKDIESLHSDIEVSHDGYGMMHQLRMAIKVQKVERPRRIGGGNTF